MSRYSDLSNNHVLFVSEPVRALERSLMFSRGGLHHLGNNTEEMTLVSQIFDCAKTIAQLKLSEVALSVFSLYFPGRPAGTEELG